MFTTSKRMVSVSQAVGFTDGIDLIDCADPAFFQYRLEREVGPVFEDAPFAVEQFRNIHTTLGTLTIFDLPGGVTFQASFVPAPASAAALLALVFAPRRRR